MRTPEIVIVHNPHTEKIGFYVDGDLMAEGWPIDPEAILQALNIKYKGLVADWDQLEDGLPESLNSVRPPDAQEP